MNVRRHEPLPRTLILGFAALLLLVWWIARPPASAEAGGGADVSPDRAGLARPAGLFQAAPEVDINGDWIGRLTVGDRRSEFRFRLTEQRGRLGGTVDFPVGAGIVESGERHNEAITLVTLNRLPETGQELRTHFNGVFSGSAIYLVMKTEWGDVNLTLQRAR